MMTVMKRDEALEVIEQMVSSDRLRRHLLATEAVMQAIAERLGEDVKQWGLAGLVHDCDAEHTRGEPGHHGTIAAELLRKAGVAEAICRAVEDHLDELKPIAVPEDRLEIALRAANQATMAITAAVMRHPSKSIDALEVEKLTRQLSDRDFAPEVDREALALSEQLGFEVSELLELSIDAMAQLAEELELDGRLVWPS